MGDYDQAIMFSILNDEPAILADLVPDISPELLYIMDRLLEKDPDDRYQKMDEVINALKRAQKKSSRSRISVPAMETAKSSVNKEAALTLKSNKNKLVIFVTAASVLILVLFFIFQQSGPDVKSTLQSTFTQITDQPGVEYMPDISPDGNYKN